jgi:hypothetical protein
MLHRAESSGWTPAVEFARLLNPLGSRLHTTARADPRIVH